MKIYRFNIFMLALVIIGLSSCGEEFLEPELSTQKDVNTSINTLGDLQSVVLGAYDRMNEADYYGRDYIVFAEVRSDNAFSNGSSGRFVGPAQFFLNATDAYPTDTWEQIYQVIANANIVINATLEDSASAEVQYVKGQAYAIRAMGHMDLLRLYGQQYAGGTLGVPVITTFNSDNLYPERAAVDQVWAQIGEDLQTAASMMDPELDGLSPTEITSWAVYALQSRYYLYIEDYESAAAAAKKVIDSGLFTLADAATYLAGWRASETTQSIFELAYTDTDNLGNTSLFFIYQPTVYGDIEVTEDLYTIYEDTDVRKELYTVEDGVIRMTGKYPTANYTDNIKVIRYAEVVLNYAEALTHLGSSEALTYLNMIPTSRGATPYTAATVDNVLLERRKELAMEGFRFFDLMRYEKDIPYVDPGQTFDTAGIPFGSPLLAFPVPESEIAANPNIVQNDGY